MITRFRLICQCFSRIKKEMSYKPISLKLINKFYNCISISNFRFIRSRIICIFFCYYGFCRCFIRSFYIIASHVFICQSTICYISRAASCRSISSSSTIESATSSPTFIYNLSPLFSFIFPVEYPPYPPTCVLLLVPPEAPILVKDMFHHLVLQIPLHYQ